MIRYVKFYCPDCKRELLLLKSPYIRARKRKRCPDCAKIIIKIGLNQLRGGRT